MARTATELFRNRIIGYGTKPADQFQANPQNYRKHPQRQRDAVSASLRSIGWIATVIENRQTGNLIDGHERVWQALPNNEDVPYLEVDLSPDEERLALAVFDPITNMAEIDPTIFDDLLHDINTDEPALQALLDELAQGVGLYGDKADVNAPTVDSIYTQEQVIEAAFAWFRANGFPYRNLAPHVSMQEINRLLTTEPEKLINTDTAYHVADTYHPHRFHAAAEGMKSPYDAFMDDKDLRRAMKLNQENGYILPQDAFGQMWIVSGTQAAANFRPGFAAYLYRQFCPPNATVLDTSTGYGGRLVGFIGSGIDGFYIGIDPNTQTHAGNLRMAQELQFADKIELHNMPAEDVPHEAVAGRCDFAFTSPPYFRKEHYSDEETQSWKRYQTGDAWRDGFLLPMMALQYAALKPGSYAIVNIADVKIKSKVYPLAEWTVEAGKVAGFEFVRRDEFPLTRRFGAGMADEVATEPVLVFRRA